MKLSTAPAEVEAKVKAKYKDAQLHVILTIGAGAQFPAKSPAAPGPVKR